MDNQSGRHFLQIPGPSNVPDKILRAIQKPTIDHRGPKFGLFTKELLSKTKKIFKFVDEVAETPELSNFAFILSSISLAVSLASTSIVAEPKCPCKVKSSSAIVLAVANEAAVARLV